MSEDLSRFPNRAKVGIRPGAFGACVHWLVSFQSMERVPIGGLVKNRTIRCHGELGWDVPAAHDHALTENKATT